MFKSDHCSAASVDEEVNIQVKLRGELTVDDIGVVEFRVCGGVDVFGGPLHVFIEVPTFVLIKHSKYQPPLFIWSQLHGARDLVKDYIGGGNIYVGTLLCCIQIFLTRRPLVSRASYLQMSRVPTSPDAKSFSGETVLWYNWVRHWGSSFKGPSSVVSLQT